jgi:hypothetical protein
MSGSETCVTPFRSVYLSMSLRPFMVIGDRAQSFTAMKTAAVEEHADDRDELCMCHVVLSCQ